MEAVSKGGEGQVQPSVHWLQAHAFSLRQKSVLEPFEADRLELIYWGDLDLLKQI